MTLFNKMINDNFLVDGCVSRESVI